MRAGGLTLGIDVSRMGRWQLSTLAQDCHKHGGTERAKERATYSIGAQGGIFQYACFLVSPTVSEQSSLARSTPNHDLYSIESADTKVVLSCLMLMALLTRSSNFYIYTDFN